ncbi:MAG: hypothetical protein IPG77_08220 [Betaproteobacteria bacterium]|nr:hypothetical protein [Betaproteobacteria bacterium]
MKLGLFAARFSNYILLAATGGARLRGREGDAFPVYAFSGVRARLYGLEAEAVSLAGRSAQPGPRCPLHDMVRGTDTPQQRAAAQVGAAARPWA